MKVMVRGLLKARQKQTATLADLEDAFEELKAIGALKLDEKALRKQQQAGIEQRADAVRAQRERWANLDADAESEGLSLEEIRKRAEDQLAGRRTASRDGIGCMGSEYGQGSAFPQGLDDPDRILHPGSGFNRRGFGANRF